MYEWNDTWRDELKKTDEKAYNRLCECESTKMDLIKMASLMWKYNPQRTNIQCYDRMCEWLCANSCFWVLDIRNEDWYIKRIKKC